MVRRERRPLETNELFDGVFSDPDLDPTPRPLVPHRKEIDRNGARTVALVGLDDTYTVMAAEVASNLGKLDPPPMIFLAGQAEVSGVDETIHAGSDVLVVLGRLAEKMEGRP